MAHNTHIITINSTSQKIWHSLTSSIEVPKYMKSIKVISDWKVGSNIEYTCYDDNDNVLEWNGTKMIWKGVINEFIPCSLYLVDYSDSPTGITEEKYTLEKINENQTKVTFEQSTTTEEIANNYKEGNEYSLKMLKEYSESK